MPAAGPRLLQAELNDAGNFVPVIGKTATVAQGETPIRIAWDYNALAGKDALSRQPADRRRRAGVRRRFAGVYVQAISAYAPHPNAAKLWMEYLYSDEGQIVWLKGYCHPIRYDDMVAKGTIRRDLRGQAARAGAYAKAVFPTLDQIRPRPRT